MFKMSNVQNVQQSFYPRPLVREYVTLLAFCISSKHAQSMSSNHVYQLQQTKYKKQREFLDLNNHQTQHSTAYNITYPPPPI